MSRWHDEDHDKGRSDFEGGGRYGYDSSRYSGWNEQDRAYREGFDDARRQHDRQEDERQEQEAEDRRQERNAHERAMERRQEEQAQEDAYYAQQPQAEYERQQAMQQPEPVLEPPAEPEQPKTP